MAEEEDQSQKTEEPTQRKLDDARNKGQVATSRELNNALMISAAAAFVALLTPNIASDLGKALIPFISSPHDIIISIDDLRKTAFDLLENVGNALVLCGQRGAAEAKIGKAVTNQRRQADLFSQILCRIHQRVV